MKKLLLVAALSVATTSVFAQAKNFEGFNAGVNLSSVGASTKTTLDGESIGFGGQSVVPSVEVGYNFVADEKFVIGLSGTYDLSKTDSGMLTDGIKLEGKNRYSVNIKPGYVVTPTVLVYGIVGYNKMEGSVTTLPEKTNFNGIGYGVGAQVMLDKNLYFKVEAQKVSFSSKTTTFNGDAVTYKPEATSATIGIGYKF